MQLISILLCILERQSTIFIIKYSKEIYRKINWISVSGGPYAAFGGRDASRGLATFSVVSSDKEGYDDLSDLNSMEMDSVREWELQFKGQSIQHV